MLPLPEKKCLLVLNYIFSRKVLQNQKFLIRKPLKICFWVFFSTQNILISIFKEILFFWPWFRFNRHVYNKGNKSIEWMMQFLRPLENWFWVFFLFMHDWFWRPQLIFKTFWHFDQILYVFWTYYNFELNRQLGFRLRQLLKSVVTKINR